MTKLATELLPSEIAIGIDIGTSPCQVSYWNGSKVIIWQDTIKSMIKRSRETSKDRTSTIFNKKLLNITFHPSENFSYLTHMLDIKVHPFIAAFVNNVWTSKDSVELLGKFLVELRSMVETKLKRTIRNVVFTVPASFSRLQQNRLYHACKMADLKVLRLMPQPTAVALVYASKQNMDEREKSALVFNMDSGYCDVAIIATEKGKYQIKAMTGSTNGGEDLLENMMHHLLPDSISLFNKCDHTDEEISLMAFLRGTILDTITQLSYKATVEVNLDMGDDLKKHNKVVTRKEFEEVNKEVFMKCERLILQCLQDAKLEVRNINHVIIVGSCGNIPKVKNIVTKIFKGTAHYKRMHPLKAALCGAAKTGAIALATENPFGNLQVCDIHFTLLSVGIRANGNNFVSLIPRNTYFPTVWCAIFTTIHDNQTEALIVVYEGEAQKAEENHLLAYFKITEVPAAPKGVPEIYVWLEMDDKKKLKVVTSCRMPGQIYSTEMVTSFDDEQQLGFCDETILKEYGDRMDVVYSPQQRAINV